MPRTLHRLAGRPRPEAGALPPPPSHQGRPPPATGQTIPPSARLPSTNISGAPAQHAPVPVGASIVPSPPPAPAANVHARTTAAVVAAADAGAQQQRPEGGTAASTRHPEAAPATPTDISHARAERAPAADVCARAAGAATITAGAGSTRVDSANDGPSAAGVQKRNDSTGTTATPARAAGARAAASKTVATTSGRTRGGGSVFADARGWVEVVGLPPPASHGGGGRRWREQQRQWMARVWQSRDRILAAAGKRRGRWAAVERGLKQHRERLDRERLRLLKEGDEEGYRRLLREVRDEKYQRLVEQTEDILRSLGIQGIDDAACAVGAAASPPAQPKDLVNITLKPYQLEGVAWLARNAARGVNCVLADEMGLGKTVQTIALFTARRAAKPGGRYLVVAPLSTLDNWMSELARFAPHLRALKFQGGREARLDMHNELDAYDVVVVQFAAFQSPQLVDMRRALRRLAWRHVVVDEGHKLNNPTSTFSVAVKELKASGRLLLTGTPLQNEVGELWGLLNFLMPALFARPTSFQEWFPEGGDAKGKGKGKKGNSTATDAEPPNEEERLLLSRRLHGILRPFLLRREKKDVLQQLPQKLEFTVQPPLTEWQQQLYKQVQAHKTVGALRPGGAPKSYTNGVHMGLRRVVLHPFLLFDGVPDDVYERLLVAGSGKLEVLWRMLTKLAALGHRVLVFTQFASVLDLLEDMFEAEFGWRRERDYERLDGACDSDARQAAMARFQAPGSPGKVFILTTRAGGQGINLQTANTVIFFDMDWNPQQDLQALARAHRLGQTQAVRVYRLVTEAPVEAEMMGVLQRKLEKEALAIQAGMYNQKSTHVDRDAKMREILTAPPSASTATTTEAEMNAMLARDDAELATLTAAPIAPRAFPGMTALPDTYAETQLHATASASNAAPRTLEDYASLEVRPRAAALRKRRRWHIGMMDGDDNGAAGSDSDSSSSSSERAGPRTKRRRR